jgi:hypothetical protein
MNTDRRTVLKAGGVAALLGATGLAGCSGDLLGGGDDGGAATGGPEVWQYDPGLLGSAPNAVFGSMDYATFYENREYLPEETRRSIEQTSSSSPVGPEDIDYVSGVGGMDVSVDAGMGGSGSGSGAGSMAVSGSFDQSTIASQMEEEGGSEVNQVGTYEGYGLYEVENMDQQFGPDATGTATIGIGNGALVVGFAFAAGTTGSATGRQAVETAIDSSEGNARRLRGSNEYATSVANAVGDATVQVGGVGDPELVDQYVRMVGSNVEPYVQGIRAGGLGMTLQGETTTFTGALTYESGQAAEDSGIAALVQGFSSQVEQEDGINSVDSNRSGNTVTITVAGDTQTLFQQANTAPTGGF